MKYEHFSAWYLQRSDLGSLVVGLELRGPQGAGNCRAVEVLDVWGSFGVLHEQRVAIKGWRGKCQNQKAKQSQLSEAEPA